MRVIGAGLGRTGTASLKVALERLLGGPCHHMFEVVKNPEQIPHWQAAAEGDMPDWHALLDGYVAQVDWPGASFWPELMEAFPDALVLLSVRDHERWFRSASDTIFSPPSTNPSRPPTEAMKSLGRMWNTLRAARFATDLQDKEATIAAAERHNAAVVAGVPADRLLVWKAADGWEPICERLAMAVPDEPFPHENTTDDFKAMRRGERKPTF